MGGKFGLCTCSPCGAAQAASSQARPWGAAVPDSNLPRSIAAGDRGQLASAGRCSPSRGGHRRQLPTPISAATLPSAARCSPSSGPSAARGGMAIDGHRAAQARLDAASGDVLAIDGQRGARGGYMERAVKRGYGAAWQSSGPSAARCSQSKRGHRRPATAASSGQRAATVLAIEGRPSPPASNSN